MALKPTKIRVALVHDWLVSYRGGEKVLEALAELFPDAPIYTLFYQPKALPESLTSRKIIYPRGLNLLRPLRKLLLPILPAAIEAFDLNGYDLIVSTSSCVAKGVLPGPSAKHLCYIHSPMRYAWDQREHYFGRWLKMPIIGMVIEWMLARLRLWDVASSSRVDQFVANSHFVAQRVKRYYGREAAVVAPPVELENYKADAIPLHERKYFIAAGAFVPYKRFDIAIRAFKNRKEKLVVMGSGPMARKLQILAGSSPNIKFKIAPNHQEWITLMRHAKALVFPCVEDFGITAIEALAAGTPVIAANAGGALDYIVHNKNGWLLTPEELTKLGTWLNHFEEQTLDPSQVQSTAANYSKDAFLGKMKREITDLMGSTEVFI